jgi:hypothetical protein
LEAFQQWSPQMPHFPILFGAGESRVPYGMM